MPTTSADQIVGKTLYAKKNINVRQYPTTTAKIYYTTKPGEMIGVVIGYHQDTAGGLWWLIRYQTYLTGYVFHGVGFFDWQKLREQGVQTSSEEVREEEKQKENESKTTGEEILSTIQKIILYSLGAFILIKIGQTFILSKRKAVQKVTPALTAGCH